MPTHLHVSLVLKLLAHRLQVLGGQEASIRRQTELGYGVCCSRPLHDARLAMINQPH